MLLLLHAPPPVASLSEVVSPTQKLVVPAIAAGALITDIETLEEHPAPSEYVTVDEPGIAPYTTPAFGSTVAAVVLLLVHVPPEVPLLKVEV